MKRSTSLNSSSVYSGLLYGKYRDTGLVRALNGLVNGDLFYVLVAGLCAIAFTFSMEPAVYTVYAVLITGILLFGEKAHRFLIVVPFFYLAPSVIHNPAVFSNSIFRQPLWLAYMVAVMVMPMVLMGIVTLRCAGKGGKKPPALWLGYLLLGAAYLCSGQLSEGASAKNTLFSAAQILSIGLPYFVGYYVIDEDHCDPAMFAKIGVAMGLTLLVEVLDIYLFSDVFARGYLDRGNIYTGWGIHNNLGNMLCVCIPGAFYLMCRSRRPLWWFAYAGLLLLAVFLTTSRGSILTGLGLFALCFLVTMLRLQKKKLLLGLLGVLAAVACLGIGVLVVLWLRSDIIQTTVEKVLKKGLFNDAGRFASWKDGLVQFGAYPIFGKGFYECSAYLYQDGVGGILPARWHNTVIQLLAGCGAVGLAAYAFHRVQTIWLVLRTHTAECWFVSFGILAILMGSLTDNHFFNIGPGIVYGLHLAFANTASFDRERA